MPAMCNIYCFICMTGVEVQIKFETDLSATLFPLDFMFCGEVLNYLMKHLELGQCLAFNFMSYAWMHTDFLARHQPQKQQVERCFWIAFICSSTLCCYKAFVSITHMDKADNRTSPGMHTFMTDALFKVCVLSTPVTVAYSQGAARKRGGGHFLIK